MSDFGDQVEHVASMSEEPQKKLLLSPGGCIQEFSHGLVQLEMSVGHLTGALFQYAQLDFRVYN